MTRDKSFQPTAEQLSAFEAKVRTWSVWIVGRVSDGGIKFLWGKTTATAGLVLKRDNRFWMRDETGWHEFFPRSPFFHSQLSAAVAAFDVDGIATPLPERYRAWTGQRTRIHATGAAIKSRAHHRHLNKNRMHIEKD